jgi:hypothetical protein
MRMQTHPLVQRLGLLTAGVASSLLGAVPSAHACGGLFCSQSNPVNQAAEQIIFTQNPDGTVTAAIQIMYEGPSESFAWVLPVQGVPTVAVSSELAFQRLSAATAPQYQLTTVFDDSCNGRGFLGGPQFAGGAGAGGTGGGSADAGAAPSVVVEAAGTVGPYDWEAISVVDGLEDPAQVAVDWLDEHGYDVTAIGPGVLRPYLEDGLNLLAFKLTKNSASGSIRPVLVTYTADNPSIPIRPTAVAANDDMGVRVFLLAAHRGIPKNYKGLELNEALIDWFNPNNNYNDVVSRAADEAEGQGFVTEFAGSATTYADVVMPSFEVDSWNAFRDAQFANPTERIQNAILTYGGWDGFDDALRAGVTLPETIAFDDYKRCIPCYAEQVVIEEAKFLQSMQDLVIKPMQDTRELFEDLPYLTRLYTTMSADEMTVDPVFDINPDLQDVSNIHTATQTISCPDANDPSFQTWRIELNQGDVVRGVDQGVWPVQISDAPAALRIVQFATSGAPRVVLDAATEVKEDVDDRNDMTMANAPRPAKAVPDVDDVGNDGCRVAAPGQLAHSALFGLSIAGFFLWRRRRA